MSHDDPSFECIEPFDIDHGELDGETRQGCFVLGFEFSTLCQLADKGRAFEQMIHSANMGRVTNMLNRRGLSFEFSDDEGGWVMLRVDAMAP